MGNEKIKLTDSVTDIVTKMSDGNIGALTIIMQILSETDKIDPDNMLGGLGVVLILDTYGIYGTDIYILNNDICDRNLAKMLAVLRATQMGMFDSITLKNACHRQDRSGKDIIPVEELYLKVKERLPDFDIESDQKTYNV
jgi:hypothetical protein